MQLLFRQIWTLVWKDLLLVLNRERLPSTLFRAITIPTIFSIYVAFIMRVYWPKEGYGVGSPHPVRSLENALGAASGGRDTLALVNTLQPGGDIDSVIEIIANRTRSVGKRAELLTNEDDLIELCRSSLYGSTHCFGAAVFYSSPNEGDAGYWNYTIRADGAFGSSVFVKKTDNPAQVYLIPLQHAIDSAIAEVNQSADALPQPVQEYPYTSMTQQQFDDKITTDIQNVVVKYTAVIWLIAWIGVIYQLVGLMAREREFGMADLIESMMPNVGRWQPQFARLVGHHLGFDIVWGPSWIIMAFIIKGGLYPKTSVGIILIFSIIAGLALTSFSLLGAAFFRKAQLSGIITVLVALGLGVAAQVTSKNLDATTVVVLSALFTPMTFTFFFIWVSRFEELRIAANLCKGAPRYAWGVPGIVLWVCLIAQIFYYPVLAALVERWLYGKTSNGRNVNYKNPNLTAPVQLDGFTKLYRRNWFLRTIGPLFGIRTRVVRAVTDLTLSATKGQITVLVGINGCGKTTTLAAIAGLSDVTSGTITLDGTGGIGICPQKNVLWDDLTVWQHARIFNRLKSTSSSQCLGENLNELVDKCGLTQKLQSRSKTLSGGQKRKLQLIMMLTGGSRVCCVDEVSGGLDPLSRRKVWDILLAERGTRTTILTTHFLDEAEFLADHMVIMSKGSLKAEGSVSELKDKLGGGYRIHMLHGTGYGPPPEVDHLLSGAPKDVMFDQTVYTVPDSGHALRVIRRFEDQGIENYQVTGPTVEEVFMKLASDDSDEDTPIQTTVTANKEKSSPTEQNEEEALLSGTAAGLSSFRQVFILFKKRYTILRRNWMPYAFAIFVPIIAAALLSVLVKDYSYPGCSPVEQVSESDLETLDTDLKYLFLVGPSERLLSADLGPVQAILANQSIFGSGNVSTTSSLMNFIHTVETFDEFNAYMKSNYMNVTPGGLYLGDTSSDATFTYYSDMGIMGVYSSIFMQNLLDVLLTGIPISTNYKVFDIPWPKDTGDALQFIFYFCLVMACYPAFFALYPTLERIRKIRALEYSNGVRSLPLWSAYLSFDFCIVLFISAVITIILSAVAGDAWYYLGYLFLVFILYGMASILLSYVLSLFAKSQLAAFAMSAGGQAVMFVLYMTAVMNTLSSGDPDNIERNIQITHYTIGLITPAGMLMRALLVSLNMFSFLCYGSPPKMVDYPGLFKIYGSPITYLIGQSLFLFSILLWSDHGLSTGRFKKQHKPDLEEIQSKEPEVSAEIERAKNSNDGLRVLHITKSFKTKKYGKVVAVDDLTFGVKKGEMFALVGPNGAGKSSTITMVRGDLQPSLRDGQIFIDGVNVASEKKTARSHLGVCPQFDAVDQLTVFEHLKFYAGIRGVRDAEYNARQVIRAVGLQKFANRMGSHLSGGNKRKLSLGIALIGNPKVVLLDEPSSGMDPLAKRTMWATLTRFVPGRSILLTTHSMEEADHLADRVGVLAKRMLDLGTTEHLRNKHGWGFHIHIVCKDSPHTPPEAMEEVKSWIESNIPGSQLEGFPYNGQLRFSVPAKQPSLTSSSENASLGREQEEDIVESEGPSTNKDLRSIGTLFVLLEENKEQLGIEYYSLQPSTFDEVFLRVVEKHNVGEEDLQIRKRNWLSAFFKSFRGGGLSCL